MKFIRAFSADFEGNIEPADGKIERKRADQVCLAVRLRAWRECAHLDANYRGGHGSRQES
jgi:hypothetical protein